jgi:CP family cyanate transporter-like MFS transporter
MSEATTAATTAAPGIGGEPASRRDRLWLAVGVILLAANLRPLVVAVSPLVSTIRADTGLSATAAGLLTTLPVFCFGALAPLGPRLGRLLGVELTLLLSMVLIAVGAAVRLAHPLPALFAGTALIGAGIAVANVLIPGVIKRDFAASAGSMTGLYTTTLSGGPALAAGLTVPLAQLTGWGWRPVLALWALITVAAVAVWLPQVRRGVAHRRSGAVPALSPVRGLWRDATAWAVTGYMGLQSLSFYASAAWLPTLLASAGMSATGAGVMLSVATVVSIGGTLGAPMLVGRGVKAGWVVVLGTVSYAAGLLGVLLAPTTVTYLWMALLGTGTGVAISLALLFVVQRAPDLRHAAPLSGMAQCVGYLLAACGPAGLGAVHDASGGWTVPVVVLLVVLVPQVLCGLAAARDRHVHTAPDPRVPTPTP